MSWTSRISTKSYYLYHYNGTDIIDYLATGDYFLMVATLISKYDAYMFKDSNTETEHKLTLSMHVNQEILKIKLSVNDQVIIIDGDLNDINPRERYCNLIAQELLFTSDKWGDEITRIYNMIVDADLTPRQLEQSFHSSFSKFEDNKVSV
jgi:hypothetical protein